MKTLLMLLSFVAVLSAQTAAPVQVGTVEGTVVRDGTSEPIPGVKVTAGIGGIPLGAQMIESLLDAEARGQSIPAELLDQIRSRAGTGARPAASAPSAVTDTAGHFVIRDVPAGNTIVQ